MSSDNFTFSGEECQITIVEKGTSNIQQLSGRITDIDTSGFARNTNIERTLGAYRYDYQGYNAATVNISFIYEQDPDIVSAGQDLPMIGLFGGSFATGQAGISGFTLNTGSSTPSQKIKLLFREYSSDFGDSLVDAERAMKFIFYNAHGVDVSANVAADGVLTGDISFTVAPFAVSGSSNYVEFEKPAGESVTNFNQAETNYDNGMGY